MKSSLMDQLHEQKNISLVDVILDVVQTCLCSYVGPIIGAWLLTHLSTLSFCLSNAHFFTTLHIHIGIPHPIVTHFSQCQCGHTIDDLGIHLLRCLCKSERTTTHDTFRDTIATIASKNETHVQRKVSHLFPCHTQRRMDIVITRNGFQTLANVVIINSTCTNLVQCALTMTTHVTTIAVQDNARSYTK